MRLRNIALMSWLVLSILSAGLAGLWQIQQQYDLRNAEFYRIQRALSNILTQNETFLPLLSGNESLAALQHKFPQLLAMEKTQGRALDSQRIEPAQAGRYWLYNPYQQTRFLIELEPLMRSKTNFLSLRLLWQQQPMIIEGSAKPKAFWHWQQSLAHPLQPFVLEADANPAWRQLSWLPLISATMLWGIIVAATLALFSQRQQQQRAEQRALYYQHSRLNALGEITAGMVHEINQPLTAIQTYVQSAQRLVARGEYAMLPQALEASLRQTQRISELLKRFRDNVSQKEILLEAVDLSVMLARVAALLEREMRAADITLNSQFAQDASSVLADALWLEQIFHNLMSNAIQAQQNSARGTIRIESRRLQNKIEIVLHDGGPGFSQEALQHAFMPFFTTRQEGIGLGMTLTETLILRMNGDITLSNDPAGGARVTLRLPAARK